jgi:phosphatidylserine/phosphatidylglycerophosphate/cardiolipin synthase-like enzyme
MTTSDRQAALIGATLQSDPVLLGSVAAALWALVGQPITLERLAWARGVWGENGPLLLWSALADAGVLTGESPELVPAHLTTLLAAWADAPMSPTPPALLFTLPPRHPLAMQWGTSLQAAAARLIEHAQEAVIICSPFLDRAGIGMLLAELRAAAYRGVALTIITTTSDHDRARSEEAIALLERELAHAPHTRHIYTITYDPNQPGIPHAKLLLVDGKVALVSSANLTRAGLRDNMEVGVQLEGPAVADLLQVIRVYEHATGGDLTTIRQER